MSELDTNSGNPFESPGDHRIENRAGLIVIIAGLLTTALAMLCVYLLNHAEVYPMSWWVNLIIPAGAILVGLIAGAGYGIASYYTGAKISKGMLWFVVGLQVVAYFVAQYVEYQMLLAQFGNGMAVSFLEYFDATTRAFAWDDNGNIGQPFGIWGYAMRLLEVAGFAGGGIIAPAMMMSVPYCEECQVYKKNKQVGCYPFSVKDRKIHPKDVAGMDAFLVEKTQVLAAAKVTADEIVKSIEQDGGLIACEILDSYRSRKKEILKLPVRGVAKLLYCPQCHHGLLVITKESGKGQEKKFVTQSHARTPAVVTRRLLN